MNEEAAQNERHKAESSLERGELLEEISVSFLERNLSAGATTGTNTGN